MNYSSFSVAMSVYKKDNPIFFDRALESITDLQTIKPNEIVLVVDGPVTDEINKVIEKYSVKYNLKVIRLEKNGGLGNALRIAIENCSNEFVARMDSDDVSSENRFEQELKILSSNDKVDIVGGDISEFIDYEENIVAYRIVPKEDIEIKHYIKKRCPFNHVTVMFKKSSVMSSGGYMDCFWNEDYYLWIRMWENNCYFYNTGTILVNVRTGLDMYKRRGGLKYYKSELFLQKYMLRTRKISFVRYLINCVKRLIVQIILPNSIRGRIYKKYARQKRRM